MSAATKNLLLLLASILGLTAGYLAAQSLRSPATSDKAVAEPVDFALPDLGGHVKHLNNWRGSVIVVNFWATWCPPCRKEIPTFIALQREYGARGLQVVGVAIDDKTLVRNFVREAGINYPVLLGEEDGMDLMARYGNRASSLPYSVVLDRTGAVVDRRLGTYTHAELEKRLLPILAKVQTSAN